nr:helix-turn-helix domain-containing protein [uncultured Dysosmobacter sp.]
MTIGQRIAQKRKELGLSQEALGAELGVSRQSIYKWESDAALPEIDKLIALSRRFAVSVGWLLGVEESPVPENGEHAEPVPSGELNETQLKMVEEIVERYAAAQPKPPAPRRRKLLALAAAAGALCLVLVLSNLFRQLERMDQQYGSLQNDLSRVESSVNRQVGSISGRVEEILKAQNDLTADYSAQLTARDLRENTVTFSLSAVPKTYAEGMEAVFLADWGQGPQEFPAALEAGQTFTAQVTTALMDSISLSVVFLPPDGTRQTQLLDTYFDLYTDSLPKVGLNIDLMWTELSDTGSLVFQNNNRYIWIDMEDPTVSAATAVSPTGESLSGPAPAAKIRMGLFKNQTLVAWAEPCAIPESFKGFEGHQFYELPAGLEVSLTSADVLQAAAVVTDVYGRDSVCADVAYGMSQDGSELTVMDYNTYEPSDRWTYG